MHQGPNTLTIEKTLEESENSGKNNFTINFTIGKKCQLR